MTGFVGVEGSGNETLVRKMLNKIMHRGKMGSDIFESNSGLMGIMFTNRSKNCLHKNENGDITIDDGISEQSTSVTLTKDDFKLQRDRLGVSPLYYGRTKNGKFCFASEVKALLEATKDIIEFPPGYLYENGKFTQYLELTELPTLELSEEQIAKELKKILTGAVQKCIRSESIGSWLSGGLDSSVIAALARPQVKKLYTFSIGLPGAPDLEFADEMAASLKSDHHRFETNVDSMIKILPEVIYHLESFDALLVRSSITNYLVAKAASDYVDEVFSGEGGDELFAGYEYLKSIDLKNLPGELIDIIGRLHNTAFQRVDRSASAFGLIVHIPFANHSVVDYALRIPAEMKIKNGIEKWILREAMKGLLPEKVLHRTKSKFWEGAGVNTLLANYADKKVSDNDFIPERNLKNGWKLNSKEELMYYRIFREHFGELENLSWMGRTKGAEIN